MINNLEYLKIQNMEFKEQSKSYLNFQREIVTVNSLVNRFSDSSV